ncbi:hypothetical protein [Capnocytophaga canimorsus]|uniref:hypothetical protein n=1 Tax=Capnocytophaga canimorsus TaxID=28188 RepID=UPI001C1F32E0|nr:hypothetical protein [Capnocytophaga canimorsus]
MDWFKGNKQRSYTKKLINAIQKRKKEESEIITIGRTTPEVQQKRAVENTLIENQKEVKKKREEQKEEEQKTEDQLFVINNAKIKMGSHMGTFKVLNNTPTIQGKTVGTKVEKSPANFSFLDGFQILSVTGDWQDIGTAKYQDNEALIKKSTLMVTGKMPPPNAPIETGKIEFIDSGQINIPENINTTGMPVPQNELISESEYKLESEYIHNHFLEVANEMVGKLENDDSNYLYKFYKKFNQNTIKNPIIEVVKKLPPNQWVSYDSFTEQIQVSERELVNIQEDNDRKIKLIAELCVAYAKYLQEKVESLMIETDGLHTFEYEFLRFDGIGKTCDITIATLTTPEGEKIPLNICLEVPKDDAKERTEFDESFESFDEFLKKPQPRRGYSAEPDFDIYPKYDTPPPPDPVLPNVGLKVSLSLKGKGKPACSISFYAGLQKEIGRMGDYANMVSVNATATLLYGTPGTNHKYNKFTGLFTLSPAYTLGIGKGRPMPLNSFNFLTGTGVYLPYQYAISYWVTGILSTAKTFPNDYKEFGGKNYNTHDTNYSHQLLGGFGIKAADLSIASTNDIFKIPIFLGQGSDQFWSANINLDLWIKDTIISYSNAMYYGKSNNLLPYNLDKNIKGQNYDFQSITNMLYNNAMECLVVYNPNDGIYHIGTRFGRVSMWPSNIMHNHIPWPEIPVFKLQIPQKSNFKTDEQFKKAKDLFLEEKKYFEIQKMNYEKSLLLKKTPTFHHLYVPYNDENGLELKRIEEYQKATKNEDSLPTDIDMFLKD